MCSMAAEQLDSAGTLGPVSNTSLLTAAALEVAGLIAIFFIRRRNIARREAGEPRPPVPARIATALLLLAVVVGAPLVIGGAIYGKVYRSEILAEELREIGAPGTATITAIGETGTVINREPEVRVDLAVEPEEGGPFQSHATWVFSVTDTQRYREGTRVRVLYDPDDHTRVTVTGLAEPD